MSYLLSTPFLLFALWSLLAVGFGVVLGRAMDDADRRENPPAELTDDTQAIRWDDRPEAWL